MRKLFSLLLFTAITTCSFSQQIKRLSHIAYNVNEGLLQSHVVDICEDGNGFIWMSTGSGVQRFDGRKFYTIPVTNDNRGLPDDRYVKFFRLQNGNLWLSHQKGISEYDISTNRFRTIREVDPLQGIHHRTFAEDDDGVWHWFSQKGCYKIDKKNRQYTDSIIYTPEQKAFKFSSAPFSTKKFFVHGEAGLLMIVNLASRKTIMQQSTNRFLFYIGGYKEDTVLAATTGGIIKMPCASGASIPVASYRDNSLAYSRHYPVQLKPVSENICLVSESGKLYELDIKQGHYISQLTTLQNKDFPDVGYITNIFYDSKSNLWIVSENDGIRKVNYHFAGFRYYGTDTRKNNFVKTIYADKNSNRVLCGSFEQGLQIFDTAQHLLKEIREFPGAKEPFTVCAFRKTAPHLYLVALMGSWNMYLLNTENFSLRKINVNTDNIPDESRLTRFPDYHLSLFPVDDSISIVQSSFYIYKYIWQPPAKLTIHQLDTFESASISSFMDKKNRLWVGSYGKYFLSTSGYKNFKSLHLEENKLVRCFSETGNEIWMGTEKGLYQLNDAGNIIKTFRKEDGLIDENIYALRFDKQGNLWLSHTKGISCRRKDGSFLHFSKNDGLQENEFNTNTSFETTDGELFFGGVNGISSFYPNSITGVKEEPVFVLTNIKIKDTDLAKDTACWSIKTITLPYYNNSLSFVLSAIGNRSPDQYNYQYQLTNQDPEWVNAGNNSEVRYVLQPGRYVFRYYAGNSFEKDPALVKEIAIVIKPPFWKTAWFLTIVLLLLAAATILITRYISRLALKRKIEELERKRMVDEERLRISREMHDDIGAGLTQITLISEASKIKEIADTSRKLIGSMNEIIWSLKPENNTLEQLLAYLREQLNKLLEYSNIQYEINFPENGKGIYLNNSQLRNLFLVTKEIVHNSIKHSKAKNIRIKCIQQENKLVFSIEDDGVGFDTTKQFTGNGLRNIHRRIEELGGSLSVSSSPGNGAHFYYTITF